MITYIGHMDLTVKTDISSQNLFIDDISLLCLSVNVFWSAVILDIVVNENFKFYNSNQ